MVRKCSGCCGITVCVPVVGGNLTNFPKQQASTKGSGTTKPERARERKHRESEEQKDVCCPRKTQNAKCPAPPNLVSAAPSKAPPFLTRKGKFALAFISPCLTPVNGACWRRAGTHREQRVFPFDFPGWVDVILFHSFSHIHTHTHTYKCTLTHVWYSLFFLAQITRNYNFSTIYCTQHTPAGCWKNHPHRPFCWCTKRNRLNSLTKTGLT